jgi:crotonobetainyl-CoA:carnitine CoA-transferase CaiB-like acyl-CoA transferase
MRPFEGIRVIDTTHVIAGPYATYQLALLGADVIKVEPLDDPDQARVVGDDPSLNEQKMGIQFLVQGSNKRAIALDLKTEAGRSILKRLVEKADIFVENYRPGAFRELGLGYDDLSACNPRLIYCSISAFGQKGPHSDRTAYDNVMQATSGLMAMTGTPEVNPIKIGIPVVDYSTGILGAFALSSALFQRERTGRGQFIDLSMLGATMMLMSGNMVTYLRTGRKAKPKGNNHGFFATSGCYPTKDGLIMLGATNLRQQRRLWKALERTDLITNNNAERTANRNQLSAILGEVLTTRTADEWEAFFNKHRIPAARVRTMMEALEDAQVEAQGLIHRHTDCLGGELAVPLTAFSLAHGGASIERPPPAIGQHTGEVLEECGYSAAEIRAFSDAGVTFGPLNS